MTNLTNDLPGSSFLDLLTINGGLQGLPASSPAQIQDGGGNGSPISLSQTTFAVNGIFNVTNSATINITGTFQVNSTAFISAGALVVPTLAADPGSPINGMMYYSSSLNAFRLYANGAWATLTLP
jgi:hypothetical protein